MAFWGVVRVEEREQRWAVGDWPRGKRVCVGVETPVVPEDEVAEEVGAENVVRVGLVEGLELGDGCEDSVDEGFCVEGCYELGCRLC